MHWDIIIVGAGSAGCALAGELAHSGSQPKVLLLEAGGQDNSPFIKFPAGQIRAIGKHAWPYVSQPDATRNNVSEGWWRGRVLGGSSSINGMMYVRGAARDFDRWDEEVGRANQASWSAAAVMPIFKALEHADQQGAERGHEGPLYVRTVRHPHRLTRAFVQSAIAHGIAFNPDYNGASQEGVSYAQLSQKDGLRCSAADAFLKPLRAYPNVTVWTDALVKKIELEGARAVGVTLLREGQTRTETADTIVLCAGAINSPQLLMLSGIGDPDELERVGIPVRAVLPGVGANLQDHPLLRLTYRVNVESFNLTGGWPQKLSVASQFALRREGPIANLFEGAAFVRTSPREPAPDVQLHFIPLGYTPTPDGGIGLAAIPSVSVLLNASYPKSRGRIRLASANPDDAPLIEPRIFADERDLETLVKGVAIVRAIMATQPIAGFVEEEIAPGAQDGVTLKDYIRAKTGIAFHPVGTCKMGVGPNAVVSPALNVHGVDNLYIADASIMPSLISGNTNAVCMMIGKKLGQSLNALT